MSGGAWLLAIALLSVAVVVWIRSVPVDPVALVVALLLLAFREVL